MERAIIRFMTIALLAGCASQKEAQKQAGPDLLAASDAKKEVPKEVQDLIKNFQRVHFAFDSSSLDPESRDALAQNVSIMQSNPDIKVEIQGHCDERGTTDYNLQLGARRAENIRTYMVTAGVDNQRLSTLSYGEEVPLAQAHAEEDFARNRRAEFKITWAGGTTGITGTVN